MSIQTAIALFVNGMLAGIALCDWTNRRQAKRDRAGVQQATTEPIAREDA